MCCKLHPKQLQRQALEFYKSHITLSQALNYQTLLPTKLKISSHHYLIVRT